MIEPGRHFAVIDPESPRRDTWLEAFGTDAVEVEGAEPRDARAPGRVGRFFRVAVRSLDAATLGRVARRLADSWGVPVEEAWADLHGEHGLPLLADDVRIFADPDEGRAYFAQRRLP